MSNLSFKNIFTHFTFLLAMIFVLTVRPVFADMSGSMMNMDMSAHSSSSTSYSTETKGLPLVKPSQLVQLHNGDTYTLTASIVKQKIGDQEIRRFAYNGSIPGPTLVVMQGDKVTIHFINNTDVDLTVHPHGLRLDYHSDGIPGISQKAAVKPGESFDYQLVFPDSGIFWYHPHVREDYTQEMGLYGNFLVKPSNKTEYESVNQEVVLTLDDLLLDKNAAPFLKDRTNYAAMGRYGNLMILNGVDKFSMSAKSGEVVRFYLTNTANTRTFNFKIPNTKMKLLASDVSRYENETWIDSLIIAPAERYIVDVLFDKPGTYDIQNNIPNAPVILGKINVTKPSATIVSYQKEYSSLHHYQPMETLRKQIAPYLNKASDHSLILTVKMPSMDGMEHEHSSDKIEWQDAMPGMSADLTSKEVTWILKEESTRKENMDINWQFEKNHFYKISIFNDPKSPHPMQHPIHFHGQRFVVLKTNGVENNNYVWKDTVLVQRGDTTEILLETSNPGKWMAHCHISEHSSSGMMLGFDVD